MSDMMLFAVLRMPYEMAMGDELSRRQFYDRAQQAADRLETALSTQPQAPQGSVTHENVKTWPERIWLQGSPDDDEPATYSEVSDHDVTWCADNINFRSDIEYIRADLAAPETPEGKK